VVTLSSAHDYVVLFAVAAAFGGLGGIAYELAQTRASSDTGALELPWFRGWRYFDLGFISSVILGAVAAVAISYFFTPEQQVAETVKGASVVVTKWQIVKVVPLSLIVGSAGGAFLEAMRARITSQLNAQAVVATQTVANQAVDQLTQAANATVTEKLAAASSQLLAAASGEIGKARASVPAPLVARVQAPRAGISEFDPELLREITEGFAVEPPLEEQVSRVSQVLSDAVAQASQETSDTLDSHRQAAHSAIDAAANAVRPT
jgi:hypothetical protein